MLLARGLSLYLAVTLASCATPAAVDAGPDAPVTPDAGTDALDAGTDPGDSGPRGPWRSELYPDDWTPAHTDARGRFLHDFSYAGYRNGETPLALDLAEAVFDVVAHGADPSGSEDSTAAFEGAIGEASEDGGIVFIPEGLYRIDGVLRVAASRVVLRGEGSARSRLFFTRSSRMSHASHLTFRGVTSVDLELPLAADAEPRAHHVVVGATDDLAVGDDVVIGWVITPDFVEEHGMTGTWQAFNDAWQPFFRRTVTAIELAGDGARVELDAPLRYRGLVRDGASLRRVRGELREVGVESLGLANATSADAAWAENQVHVLTMSGVRDAWVRDVASFASPAGPAEGEEGEGAHLQSCGILVQASKRVTIADAHLAHPLNRGPGGNGYLFEIRASSEILVRDSTARGGRHNFIQNWGFGTSGCVWLRVHSAEGRSLSSRGAALAVLGASEFHHSLATANLIDDSTIDDGWSAVNRASWSSGAGHTATECVLWRTSGAGVVRSFQYGVGYVIGSAGTVRVTTDGVPWEQVGTEPLDFTEGLGRGDELEPRSLYEDQLARRTRP